MRCTRVAVLLLHLAGIALFIHGFLFVTRELDITNTEYCDPLVMKPIRRLLLIVIDGLRHDYASQYLQRVTGYSPQSVFYETYSDPPTVTLQRLKSICTGTLPVFVEIRNNFDFSHRLESDSFVTHFSKAGNVTVIGDDTWVALFGARLSRQFTAPSFDVHDLHGVDNAVFRAFPSEMENQISSLVIGHFLGVDHAAHVFGFKSDEVRSKIAQIEDFLIDRVLPKLNNDDLLIVMSDHGMTDGGAHGGASDAETSSFLFGYSPALQMRQTKSRIDQIDVCPTISLLFGFPIPAGNLGTAIPDFFPDHQTQAKEENERQFSLFLNSIGANVTFSEIAAVFRRQWAEFNFVTMFLGLALLVAPIILLPQRFAPLSIIHSISLLSDSFIFGENLIVQFCCGVLVQSPVLRVLGMFGRCREDTHRRICQPQLRIKSVFNKGIVKLIGDSFIVPLAVYCGGVWRYRGDAEVVHFLSLHGFFATGHQFTFSNLNVDAGFAFGRFHPVWSAVGVFVNTFLADFVATGLVREIEELQMYRTWDLIGIAIFAVHGRRHLMVAQVIVPRFLFQSALTLLVDTVALFRR
jgi:hypothetical protein